MKSPIAINLNFDSLNEAYGFPPGYRDPSFFEGFNRLAELAAEFDFPLSIFIVGKDLENPDHAAQVRDWVNQGHEIGNHSWSHHFNLGSLPKHEIWEEVIRGHDAIFSATGIEPKGFIAPAWSTSKSLISTLIEMKYFYDTSAFPSILLFPMTAKIALNHAANWRKGIRILRRSDWHIPFTSPLEPHLVDCQGRKTTNADNSLCLLPLPTSGRLQPCIWHTLGFILGWKYTNQQTKKLLNKHNGFYYLIHPGDFMGEEDLDPQYIHHLARMEQPIEAKINLLREVFSMMKSSSRPIVTMMELAQYHKQIISNPPINQV
jgi:peptidoglycan/xylan/chitin deacetylase (PgdA/CDA1 family)